MVSIEVIEDFFNTNEIPTDYQPWNFAVILDHQKFIWSHISYIKGGKPCKSNHPYYERLLMFYQYCITKNQSL
jgi:hypothetical protein